MLKKSSPLFFERYELKYLIHESLIEDIVAFIEPYCELDPYCLKEATGYYRINSLYLDSLDHIFFRRKQDDIIDRFNMRIRNYGFEGALPYFLEVKTKKGPFVKKYRSKILTTNLENLIFGNLNIEDKNHQLFARLASTHGVEPKIMTSYDRLAYLSNIDEYARVTFDRNLQYYQSHEYSMNQENHSALNYDNELIFPEGCNIVLELKSTAQVPHWMLDLIRYFQLDRSSFSKFSNSLTDTLWRNQANHAPRSPVLVH